MSKKSIYLMFLFTILAVGEMVAQSINTDFGKNRVQYHEDFTYWNRYETENFITYWYGKARNVAEPVIQLAELNHQEIQNILEHRINDKIEILVYTDVTDFKQSNIGVEEIFISNTGRTKIVGNKMFVYFNGNHNDLRIQIREGIASVYLNAMLFGDNFQEVVQNAVLLDLPEWYKQGIISYSGRYWDHLLDDELRDILYQNPKYKNFDKFSEDYPKIAGHSMWFFLDQNFGKSTISNLLYLTRITRNLDNALLYVYNNDIDVLSKQWAEYYEQHFDKEEGKFDDNDAEHLLPLKNKGHIPVSQLKLSDDGNYLAYAYNHLGKYKVVLQDLNTEEKKIIFKYGYKNNQQATDFNYPLIAWHPDGSELSYIYEHRDILTIVKYNIKTGEKMEQLLPPGIQRVWSIDYVDDLNYIFSASANGFSDLFHYNSKNRNFNHITDDFYDDLDAEYVELDGKKGILFSSNRRRNHIFKVEYDTIVPTGQFDLFFYDLEADDKSVKRITNTPDVSERYPFQIKSDRVTYLADENGVINRYIVSTVDPSSYYPVSNKSRNMIKHHAVLDSDKHIYTYYHDGDYKVYYEPVDWNTPIIPFNTRYNNREYYTGAKKNSDVFIPFAPEILEVEQEKNYTFQSRFADPENIEPITNRKELREENESVFNTIIVEEEAPTEQGVHKFAPPRITAAGLRFRIDNFTTTFDNNILFEGLESFTGNSDELLTNPLGLLFKANIKDIFEDYTVEAGARFPLQFNGSEYFVTFSNRKKLIDRRMAFYRRSQTEVIDENAFPAQRAKKVSLLGLYQWKLPFDVYRSIRATTQLRIDNFHSEVVDNITFNDPFINEQRAILKLEYIFDNTIDFALNIKHGTRYKVYAEVINEFNIDFIDNFEFDLSRGFTTVLGVDARHYQPVLRYSVFALRFAGATSFGNKQNIYYLGGVNNSFVNRFEQNIPIPEGDFAFKTNAFHLRGFNSNIRNGTSHALVNAELRIPFFRYFMGNYGGSNFFRNFQFVLFYDVGTAWHGLTPFSDANPLNVVTVESPPVLSATIRYFRDPLVMGYGGGVRMKLLGYFLRLDYATGVETRVRQDPRLHFSIGMDF